jgi:plastocyanin
MTMQQTRGHAWRLASALAAIFVVLALAIGARGAFAQDGAAVSIVDFAFDPASVEVRSGDTVTWTNTGAAPHTVTADDGSFDSGQLAPGATFSQTFDARGDFTYHCEIHPQMTGTVSVTGGGGGGRGGDQAAATPAVGGQTAQVPRTGVGSIAGGQGTALALLAAGAAALLGIGARLAYRRS